MSSISNLFTEKEREKQNLLNEQVTPDDMDSLITKMEEQIKSKDYEQLKKFAKGVK